MELRGLAVLFRYAAANARVWSLRLFERYGEETIVFSTFEAPAVSTKRGVAAGARSAITALIPRLRACLTASPDWISSAPMNKTCGFSCRICSERRSCPSRPESRPDRRRARASAASAARRKRRDSGREGHERRSEPDPTGESAGLVHRCRGNSAARRQAGSQSRNQRGDRRGRAGCDASLCKRRCSNVENTIVSSPYLSNNLNDQTRAFAAAYRKKHGEAPELHGAKAYDGFMIFSTALRNLKGKWTPEGLAAAIQGVGARACSATCVSPRWARAALDRGCGSWRTAGSRTRSS